MGFIERRCAMELLYGGIARRIGYEGGRAQNRARIEMLRVRGSRGPSKFTGSKGVQPEEFSLAAWLLAS